MKKIENLLVLFILVVVGLLSACSNPISDEEKRDKDRLDSMTQAETDNKLIDGYIRDNGIDSVSIGDYGIRRVILQLSGSKQFPKYNDILSIHYTGRFIDGTVFFTNEEKVAVKSDSLRWISLGVDFSKDTVGDTIDIKERSLKEILIKLSKTEKALNITLYKENILYLPRTFNYTKDGQEITFNEQPFGFKQGLIDLLPHLALNGSGLIFLPSAVGNNNPRAIEEDRGILIYEFQLVNFRN